MRGTLNINVIELDNLLYQGRVLLAKNMQEVENVYVWGFTDTLDKFNTEVFRKVYETLERVYLAVKQGFSVCLTSHQYDQLTQKFYELTKTCKTKCRNDVLITENTDWDNKNCRSVSEWNKFVNRACEYVFEFENWKVEQKSDFLQVITAEKIPTTYLYDFLYKTWRGTSLGLKPSDCVINYKLLLLSTCKTGFDVENHLLKCELGHTYKSKEICISNLETYTYLINCGISYQTIEKMVKCNTKVSFQYKEGCLYMFHGEQVFNLCDLRYKKDFENFLTDCNLE